MTKRDIIRAWRDTDYHESLSESARTALPAHPSGAVELTDHDLGNVTGADNFDTACVTFFDGSELCVFKTCDSP